MIELEYGRANTTTRRIDERFTFVPAIADLSPGMRWCGFIRMLSG
jgi:hypothetical protein